jgi:hypothetical protein
MTHHETLSGQAFIKRVRQLEFLHKPIRRVSTGAKNSEWEIEWDDLSSDSTPDDTFPKSS